MSREEQIETGPPPLAFPSYQDQKHVDYSAEWDDNIEMLDQQYLVPFCSGHDVSPCNLWLSLNKNRLNM